MIKVKVDTQVKRTVKATSTNFSVIDQPEGLALQGGCVNAFLPVQLTIGSDENLNELTDLLIALSEELDNGT